MSKEVKYPKVRLFYDRILTTLKTNKVTPGGVILSANELGEILTRQTVVAAGPAATVQPGDEVEINLALFPVKTSAPPHGVGPDKKQIIVPLETIDGEKYLFITTRELKWVYKEISEDEPKS